MASMSEYDMNHSPETLAPLPAVLRHGLAAVGTFGVLSFISSTALTAFLAYKLIMWQMPREESKDTVSERPESPPAFDHNGFLVPHRPLSPLKEEDGPPEKDTFGPSSKRSRRTNSSS
ncbi:unnamed protein product [Parascedosporium putredinis]|uniref:Transmembrane protein n=1 Tax=Parascedosporium putredinis TaxID=1442378 RepID=A0A9P1GZ88_9PEZI|nr:unnamed protein product [Parascedosporium putredinis]CAI7991400.1 unnamed protein product [Parascedosporium putredinis]